MLRLLFLAGAAALPASVLAAPAVAAQDARLALGRELAAATTPVAAIRRDSAKAFDANFRRSFLASDKGREMERRVPGLLDAMAAAGVAEWDRVVDTLMPRMMDEAGTTYAGGMSEAQLRDALAFYATGLGRKLVALIPEAVDVATMRIDYSPLLTADERRRFAAFSASPAGRRMNVLYPVLAADIARTIEQGIAAEMERINARIVAAGRAFAQARGLPAR
jgi:hypothetical protein